MDYWQKNGLIKPDQIVVCAAKAAWNSSMQSIFFRNRVKVGMQQRPFRAGPEALKLRDQWEAERKFDNQDKYEIIALTQELPSDIIQFLARVSKNYYPNGVTSEARQLLDKYQKD